MVLIVRDPPSARDAIGIPVNCLRVMVDLTKLTVRDVLGRMTPLIMMDRHRIVLGMKDPQMVGRTIVIQVGLREKRLEVVRDGHGPSIPPRTSWGKS